MNRILKTGILITAALTLVFGAIVADTVSKPLSISLRSHIEVCKKTDQGGWEVIDEVGPSQLQFQASLLELANAKKVSSDFTWSTRSKKGQQYSVRLLEPANVNYNPATGQLSGDLKFDITWGDKKVTVPARITTETLSSPVGSRSGKRANGILGVGATTMTLVSANDLLLPGESVPLKLVCTEEYTLTPRKQ